jgi:hypothetical protein|tara:strand:+ start:664 stop:1002 length:339 start_codon:yes stop_codon:yes gene_type:complete
VNYKYFIVLVAMTSCTLQPDITVQVPEGAVQRSTSINVDWPDIEGFLQEQIGTEVACDFNELPENSEGFIAKCTSNCCLWVYEADVCVERWCLNLENNCGWELTDWNCLESR